MSINGWGHVETAVVILCYNGLHLLQELLPITLEHTKIDEKTKLFIVNNASQDKTENWIQENYPDLPYIALNKNYGFAGGYNKALEIIDADYYVLLSTDVEVEKDWLPPLVNLLKKNNRHGACQPKILSFHEKDRFEYAGAAGGYIDYWGVPFCRGRIFSSIESDNGQYNNEQKIFWASGCCFAVRAEAWNATGGFDQDFFAHMEEIDLCWRIQKAHFEILACPDSTVYHMGGQTLGYDNPKKLYLNSRNNLAMLTKNWSRTQLIWKLPIRILIDWIGAIYFLFHKGFPFFKAIIKGHYHFLKKINYWIKKRQKNQPKTFRKPYGVFYGSIIFNHFFKNIKTFSHLRSL